MIEALPGFRYAGVGRVLEAWPIVKKARFTGLRPCNIPLRCIQATGATARPVAPVAWMEWSGGSGVGLGVDPGFAGKTAPTPGNYPAKRIPGSAPGLDQPQRMIKALPGFRCAGVGRVLEVWQNIKGPAHRPAPPQHPATLHPGYGTGLSLNLRYSTQNGHSKPK